MRTATCYISQTGKAFQQPLNCLKFEFDTLADEFRRECLPLAIHKYSPHTLQARFALIRERLATLEAKAAEFYALVDRLEPPKPARMAETEPNTNVIELKSKHAA